MFGNEGQIRALQRQIDGQAHSIDELNCRLLKVEDASLFERGELTDEDGQRFGDPVTVKSLIYELMNHLKLVPTFDRGRKPGYILRKAPAAKTKV